MKEQIGQIPDIPTEEKLRKVLIENFGVKDEQLQENEIFDLTYDLCMGEGELARLMESNDFTEEDRSNILKKLAKSDR